MNCKIRSEEKAAFEKNHPEMEQGLKGVKLTQGLLVLHVKCGTSVTVNMKVVDSANGQLVVLDKVALTWYDMDEGKKEKVRATVTTCGSTGAIVSENTELP